MPLLQKRQRYLCFGVEVGVSGTSHLQGFVQYNSAVSFNVVRKFLPGAHLERSKGSPWSNREYCMKDDKFYEFGVVPMSDESKGQMSKDRYRYALECAKAGNLDQIPPDLYIRHLNAFEKIKLRHADKALDLSSATGIWIFGTPGSGKSYYARATYKPYYMKMQNKWWDGYMDEPNVILDDFDFKGLGHLLKIWGDEYGFNAESKGSVHFIRPKKIIVTSNYTIRDMFGDDQEMMLAVARRFEQFEMKERVCTKYECDEYLFAK